MKHKLYNRLLSLALAVGLVVGMLPGSAAVSVTEGSAGQAATLGNSDSGLELSKKLVTNADGTYSIQLEAYATGEIDVSTEYKAVPTDIVLVLDQSGSMDEEFQSSSTSGYQKLNISENSEAYSNRNNLYYFNRQNYVKVSVSRELTWDGFRYTYSWNGQTATSYGRNESIPSPLKGNLYRYTTTTTTTTKQQALKDAVTEFVNSVQAQAQEDGVDHRIAMVGFASDNSQSGWSTLNYGNTELLSTTAVVNYQNATNSDYKNSLVSVNSNGTVNSRLTTAIDRIDAEGGTAINLGMKMAQNILNNNPVSSNEERNQVVIVFTDGEPGIFTDDSDSTRTNNYANPAISTAKAIKDKGVKVYSVGIFDGADADEDFSSYTGTDWDNSKRVNRFMHYLSSNYPKATSMSYGGTPDEKKGYYLSAADADTLKDIFQKISDDIQTGGSSSTLDSNAIVRDVLTKELQLPEGTTANDITIETYKAANGSTVTNPDAADAWIKDSVNGITASIGTDGRTIDVTGFDFSRNFVADTGRVEGNVSQTGDFYGRKLVITIPVEPNPDFFGGNNIDTNADGSGVYVNAEETTPVDTFVSPNMNIPVNCNVTGNDQSIYITQSADVAEMVNLGAEPDGWNNSHVTITYQVKDGDRVIGTYTIQPGATTGTWDGDSVSPEDCTNYTVTCTVTPNEGKNDSVGNAAVTAKKEDVRADVHVFTPTVTLTDSTKAYGTVIDENLLNGHRVSIAWNDKSNDVNAPAPNGTAPTLTYTFTGKNGALPETLTEEAHVKVSAVKIGETDITDATSFKWQNDSNCPTTCSDPNSNGYQFRIHVQKGGLTINKTVVGLDENGLNELKGKLTFEVKGDNGYEQTVPFNVNGWTYTPNGDGTYTCIYKLDVPTGTYTVTESGDYRNITNSLFDDKNSTTTDDKIIVTKDGANAILKNTYTPADGYLTINKEIKGEAFNDGRDTFTFKVTAQSGKDAGKVWYFTIKGAGTVVNKKLPVGDYKVEELSNINYTCATSVQEIAISNRNTETNPATVTFTNTPDKTDIPTDGGGVKNVAEIKEGQIVWKPEKYGEDAEIVENPETTE